MAKSDYKSVTEYISTHPAPVQTVLRRLRAIIRKALPKAEEVISYQIPTYKLNGAAVIYFAAWKEHYSLYPVSAEFVESLGIDGSGYTFSKGTMRFPLDEPVPVTLIERIVKHRKPDAAAGANTRAPRTTAKMHAAGKTAKKSAAKKPS